MSQNDHSELIMRSSTEPVDVVEFLIDRTEQPAILRDGEVIVFNYRNDPLAGGPLASWAATADAGVYIRPYQISGIWAFMQSVLPPAIRNGDILAYRQDEGEYVDYVNWRREYVTTGGSFDDDRATYDAVARLDVLAREEVYDAIA